MSKIIKDGKLPKEYKNVITVTCNRCETVFEEEQSNCEYITKIQVMCTCPHCHYKILAEQNFKSVPYYE